MKFLNSAEDCQWLRDTHLKGLSAPAFQSFTLHGNEDSPDRLDLYGVANPRHTVTPAAVYVSNHPAEGYSLRPAGKLKVSRIFVNQTEPGKCLDRFGVWPAAQNTFGNKPLAVFDDESTAKRFAL